MTSAGVISAERVGLETDGCGRPRVAGKFLQIGESKLYVRGVTYGTFRPDDTGAEFNDPETVNRDFAQMTANGINAVRTYTVPPRWLLDTAQRHGLYVMVGLPWEQHIAFLDDSKRARDIEETVRASVRSCAGHPAILFYAVGNEIPTSIVRWHGARRIERFIHRLYRAVKSEDPGALVTYVNYPSTEYLDLRFLDLVCFNVYLETQEQLSAYLSRLQNKVQDRPLILAEVGLDSRRHGEERQAEVLDWQIHTAFESGCAGIFLFAWTDEWYRGGFDIDDWDFGLTDRQRRPKPGLETVRSAFSGVPFLSEWEWPRISVVVCSYDGARTIEDCCAGLAELEYPDFEVIVVDDGSTDETASIARHFGFRVISTPNRGLSSARNTGLKVATGEIIAYIDDDARPDRHWLTYLASTFMTTTHAGIGGPNLAPPGDGFIADCVANAPGGPVHVLISDQIAEHIPGCNMAYRKEALEAIGGFDSRFRVAGDDVDMCWRLQEQGLTLGFSPAAMVWHHRRNSVRTYWRQQRGYGRAEAMLEQKWPERYNLAGHVSWGGQLYGKGLHLPLPFKRKRLYQGSWGTAPFQSVYEPAPSVLGSLPLMPEWYLLVAMLTAISALGLVWKPLLLALPLVVVGLIAPVVQSVMGGAGAQFVNQPTSRWQDLCLRILTSFLHLIQPLARLWGRLHSGLTPWRYRGNVRPLWPRTKAFVTWRAYVLPSEGWLASLYRALRELGAVVRIGGDYDGWDLKVRGGALGETRIRLVIEEHGASKQLIRFRAWPRISGLAAISLGIMGALTFRAWFDGADVAASVLTTAVVFVVVRTLWECGSSIATASYPFEQGGMETYLPFELDTPEVGRLVETGGERRAHPVWDELVQQSSPLMSDVRAQTIESSSVHATLEILD